MLVTGAITLMGSGTVAALWPAIFSRRTEKDKQELEDHRLWYEQSHTNYATAKKEVQEAKQECADCRKQLMATRLIIYTLMESLEDQIIPAIGLPGTDMSETRKAMREAIHKAREAL